MSPNAPAVSPTFRAKEVVAQGLSVEVIDLITGVVDMDRSLFRSCCEEQALNLVSALQSDIISTLTHMMISVLLSEINMVENSLVFACLWIEDSIRGLYIDKIVIP